jgi:CelD/BcsL family acetyltransferase involved in cellulose biosynthesis
MTTPTLDAKQRAGDVGKQPIAEVDFATIEDYPSFKALEREWNELHAAAARSYLSQTFQWCDVAFHTVAQPSSAKLYCLTARSRGRLILVWPWIIHRRGLLRCADQLGCGFFERHVLLVADLPDAVHLVCEAWRRLREMIPADIVTVRRVHSESALAACLRGEHGICVVEPESHPTIEWDQYPSWDAYITRGNKEEPKAKRRHHHRRRLEAAGTITFGVLEDPEKFEEAVDWLWRHKRVWMSRAGLQNPWIERADFRNFLSAMKRRPSPAGALTVFFLRVDEKPIAGALAAIDKSWISPFISTFDEEWSKHSAGRILLESLLQWAYEHNLAYDLGAGDEPYKKQYLSCESQLITFTLPRSLWGTLHIVARGWTIKLIIAVSRRIPSNARQAIKRLLKR